MTSVILGLAAAAIAASPAAAQQSPTIAIVDTTVLPMTGTERLTRQTVIVSGDRIVAVGPSNQVRVPAGARTLDGRGKVVMPGLVDMHIHLAPTPGELGDPAQRALAVMLSHGITTARTMAGSPQNLTVRGKVESGALAGPRIYAAAPALHAKNTPSVEQAHAAVQKARTDGFDLIKSHEISDAAVWQAVQDEARRQGMPVGGHVANAIGLDRALTAGQQVEHLDSIPMALLPADAPERQEEFGQIPPPPVAQRVMAVSDAKLAALAAKVAAAKSWHVPTLSLFEKIVDTVTPTTTLAALPEMRFIPPTAAKQWAAQREGMKEMGLTAEDGRLIADVRRRIATALHRAGVPLMAGSDTAQFFHVWGPALHQEIRSLAAAGLSPMAALRSATSVPRNYFRSLPNGGSALGWKADFGTVEAGARADLILLADDPSINLAALDRPAAVIAAGRFHDRAMLDAMLVEAEAAAKAPPVAAAAAPAAARQVFAMRHLPAAQGQGQDPALSEVGRRQAAALPQFLRAGDLKAVFATPYKRTQQTAAPVAAALGLPVTTYDPADPDGLLRAVTAVPGNVLIVGHSNTVPDIVRRLGGKAPAIGEKDFGTIFRVDPRSKSTSRFTLGADAPAVPSPN